MNRIIIQNYTEKLMADALYYVHRVLIARKVFANAQVADSTITTFTDGIAVSCDRNKKSYRFIVCQDWRSKNKEVLET